MKNKKERDEFIDNPANWQIVEVTPHARVSRITYKKEHRYKLEVYETIPGWDFDNHERTFTPKWVVRHYYKEPEQGYISGFIQQSLTEVRDWLKNLDKTK